MGLTVIIEDDQLRIEKVNLANRTKTTVNVLDEACELKILGGTDEGGSKVLLEIKNHRTGERVLGFLPMARARLDIPHLLIKYYEKHIEFKHQL